MLIIERLLGTTIEAQDGEETDLDQAHVDKIVHVLRRDCGEHGAHLAGVLLSSDAPPGEREPERREPEQRRGHLEPQ